MLIINKFYSIFHSQADLLNEKQFITVMLRPFQGHKIILNKFRK